MDNYSNTNNQNLKKFLDIVNQSKTIYNGKVIGQDGGSLIVKIEGKTLKLPSLGNKSSEVIVVRDKDNYSLLPSYNNFNNELYSITLRNRKRRPVKKKKLKQQEIFYSNYIFHKLIDNNTNHLIGYETSEEEGNILSLLENTTFNYIIVKTENDIFLVFLKTENKPSFELFSINISITFDESHSIVLIKDCSNIEENPYYSTKNKTIIFSFEESIEKYKNDFQYKRWSLDSEEFSKILLYNNNESFSLNLNFVTVKELQSLEDYLTNYFKDFLEKDNYIFYYLDTFRFKKNKYSFGIEIVNLPYKKINNQNILLESFNTEGINDLDVYFTETIKKIEINNEKTITKEVEYSDNCYLHYPIIKNYNHVETLNNFNEEEKNINYYSIFDYSYLHNTALESIILQDTDNPQYKSHYMTIAGIYIEMGIYAYSKGFTIPITIYGNKITKDDQEKWVRNIEEKDNNNNIISTTTEEYIKTIKGYTINTGIYSDNKKISEGINYSREGLFETVIVDSSSIWVPLKTGTFTHPSGASISVQQLYDTNKGLMTIFEINIPPKNINEPEISLTAELFNDIYSSSIGGASIGGVYMGGTGEALFKKDINITYNKNKQISLNNEFKLFLTALEKEILLSNTKEIIEKENYTLTEKFERDSENENYHYWKWMGLHIGSIPDYYWFSPNENHHNIITPNTVIVDYKKEKNILNYDNSYRDFTYSIYFFKTKKNANYIDTYKTNEDEKNSYSINYEYTFNFYNSSNDVTTEIDILKDDLYIDNFFYYYKDINLDIPEEIFFEDIITTIPFQNFSFIKLLKEIKKEENSNNESKTYYKQKPILDVFIFFNGILYEGYLNFKEGENNEYENFTLSNVKKYKIKEKTIKTENYIKNKIMILSKNCWSIFSDSSYPIVDNIKNNTLYYIFSPDIQDNNTQENKLINSFIFKIDELEKKIKLVNIITENVYPIENWDNYSYHNNEIEEYDLELL